MRELSSKEIKAVKGGIFGWIANRAVGAYNTMSSMNWSGTNHNSKNFSAATNRL